MRVGCQCVVHAQSSISSDTHSQLAFPSLLDSTLESPLLSLLSPRPADTEAGGANSYLPVAMPCLRHAQYFRRTASISASLSQCCATTQQQWQRRTSLRRETQRTRAPRRHEQHLLRQVFVLGVAGALVQVDKRRIRLRARTILCSKPQRLRLTERPRNEETNLVNDCLHQGLHIGGLVERLLAHQAAQWRGQWKQDDSEKASKAAN